MAFILLFIFSSNLFCLVATYENIAFNKPAWQQYPFSKWGADRAVDGRKTDLSAGGGQCTISDDRVLTAEWRVDLLEVHSIVYINIIYRTDGFVWDEHNGYTTRFLGFSLYISNTTTKKDGILCFKDTVYTRETIPNPQNISCRVNGRYVIYYNNRTNPPFPADYSAYAFNELCEVEVYGCQNASYFGDNCSTPCHRNCLEGLCDVVDGTCLGCVPGYTGPTCDTVQDDGNTSTTLYVVTAALSVSVIINILQLLYIILLSKRRKKRKKSETYEQTRNGNVFTQDISGYDSMTSRPEDTYQELATVTGN